MLPDDFHFLSREIRVFVPLAFSDKDRADDQRHSQNHEQIARLARGVTLVQAQAQVDSLNAHIVDRAGPLKATLINVGYATRMVGLEADLVRNVRAALQLLWGGVLLVVLIAAVNIANLSLARGSARMKELAVKLKGLVEGEQARVGAYYQPFFQVPTQGIGLAVRTRGDLAATTAAVQRALAEIDPDTRASDVFSMSERVEKSLNPRRAPMLLSTAFGLLALLLASIVLYGVVVYHVSQRTREIGIRLALGSDAR